MDSGDQLQQTLASARRWPTPFLFLFSAAALAVFTVFSVHGVEFGPSHRADETATYAIAGTAGLLCFALMFRVKPRTWKTNLSSFTWSFLVAFTYTPITFGVVQQLHSEMDFLWAPVEEGERDFPIDMAYSHYNRGNAHYRVSLRDYPASLVIDERDYLQAFGKTERVWPDDFCIHVRTQWTTHALRAMEGALSPLPAGSLMRCPAAHGTPAKAAA